jgi:hypothetical protein
MADTPREAMASKTIQMINDSPGKVEKNPAMLCNKDGTGRVFEPHG